MCTMLYHNYIEKVPEISVVLYLSSYVKKLCIYVFVL